MGTYSEKVSAAAKVRPEFDRLLRDAHQGKFEYILVSSLDRLGRSMLGNLQVVLDLDRKGVKVIWYERVGSTLKVTYATSYSESFPG